KDTIRELSNRYNSSPTRRLAAFAASLALEIPSLANRSALRIADWPLLFACERSSSISRVARSANCDALCRPSFVLFLIESDNSRIPSLARSSCLRPSLVPSNNQATVPAASPTNAYVTMLFFVFISMFLFVMTFFNRSRFYNVRTRNLKKCLCRRSVGDIPYDRLFVVAHGYQL